MMVVTFSVSVSLYRKGHPLVKYFLIGFMIITWSASFGYLIMERTFGRNADY